MEVQGTIYAIGPIQEITDKFKKQEVILETLNGEYTQFIKIQFTQKRIDLLQAFESGDEVVCSINLTGKLYKNKEGREDCFTSVDCWKIGLIIKNTVPGILETEDGLPF
jgi:hypothetical protein